MAALCFAFAIPPRTLPPIVMEREHPWAAWLFSTDFTINTDSSGWRAICSHGFLTVYIGKHLSYFGVSKIQNPFKVKAMYFLRQLLLVEVQLRCICVVKFVSGSDRLLSALNYW